MRVSTFRSIIAEIVFTLIVIIRPFIGPQGICLFPVSCGLYAKQQLEQEPFFTALKKIIKRLCACQPFTK